MVARGLRCLGIKEIKDWIGIRWCKGLRALRMYVYLMDLRGLMQLEEL
jgi:hypothetical protein